MRWAHVFVVVCSKRPRWIDRDGDAITEPNCFGYITQYMVTSLTNLIPLSCSRKCTSYSIRWDVAGLYKADQATLVLHFPLKSKMPSGYTSFSPTGRVKRMERKLDQTQKIYDEIITVAGPKLQTAEGQAILTQSEDERRSAWRLVCTLSQVYSI